VVTTSCSRNPIDRTAFDAAGGVDAADTARSGDTGRDLGGNAADAADVARMLPDASPDAPIDQRSDLPGDPPVDRSNPGDATNDTFDGRGSNDGIDANPGDSMSCPVDCNHLPNVRPDVVGICRAGHCVLPGGACLDGFENCTPSFDDGCETDLSTDENCGQCGYNCLAGSSSCGTLSGSHICLLNCAPPTPDRCDMVCTDLQTDSINCGVCGAYCPLPHSFGSGCKQGACEIAGCYTGWANCTSEPGCETELGTTENCGSCGDKECGLENTLFTCNDGTGCGAAVCAPGYANCDDTSPDCETPFTASAGCLPRYLRASAIPALVFGAVATAIAPDGSIFLAGTFKGTVDFDPSAGQDIRTSANDADGYITKFNADGSYAWTSVLAGRGEMSLTALAATATGAVVATGSYWDTVDLDPGPSTDFHFTLTPLQDEPFVVKLAASGAFVWGRSFAGTSDGTQGQGNAIAVDASEAVYVGGYYLGDMDFDPSAATDAHSSAHTTGFLAKLDATGSFGWARTFANGDCDSSLFSVTVATDGSVWGTGPGPSGQGCTLTSRSDGDVIDAILVVKLGATGDARGMWSIGEASSGAYSSAIATGPNGAVYIGGTVYSGPVDFDPGPGVAQRWFGTYGGGFVVQLDAVGSFRWIRVIDKVSIGSLAGTRDGGVIAGASAPGGFVTRLTADGGAVWTFLAGGPSTLTLSVAAGATDFAVAGSSSGSADFDPGPDVDLFSGDLTFVSRYAF
jgi:hypothetical protein